MRPAQAMAMELGREGAYGADTVIGNYRIVRKLGEGGMGVVYLGEHTLLGRRAAIKVLRPALSERPEIVNRFFNEARAATSISDPGIVQIFDFGYHTDGSAFIVMELLEGEPLDQRLARLGRLPVQEALRLCRQIASSLAAAHARHIIHRDLKPENIFLVHDAEVASGERSKIVDFGIAKLSDDPGKLKTSAGTLIGTPTYMSPEQCRGLIELDHRSDIYSLGCVLFYLITGRPPFDAEGMGEIIVAHIREPAPAPSSLVPEIAPNVDALVLRCLAKAPADRYQSMAELATAINQIMPRVTPESLTPNASVYQAGAMPQPSCLGAMPPPSYPGATPPLPPSYPGAATPLTTPTTLGGGVGQLVTRAPRSRGPGRWIAIGLLGGAVTAFSLFALRHDRASDPTAGPHDASGVQIVMPGAATGSSTAEPHAELTAIDAMSPVITPPAPAVSDTEPPGAAVPDGGVSDAPPVAEAIDAAVPPPRRPKPSGQGPRQSSKGGNHASSTGSATPPVIDRGD